MKQLAQIQAKFQDYVLGGNPVLAGEIEGDNEEVRETRLTIYRNAYRLCLIEVLSTDYEVLRAYMGGAPFDALADDYVAAYPSTFRNVRWFGSKLAEFLESRHAGPSVLSELAQFEWSLGLAFDALDEAAVRFEQLTAVPQEAWADLRFRFHRALMCLDLHTNAVGIWQDIKNNRHEHTLEAFNEPKTWVIWRKDWSPFFRSLQEDEASALKATISQQSFGELCAGLCTWVAEEEAAARAAGILRGWVEEGWIVQLLVTD
jgi:hypothetical protein